MTDIPLRPNQKPVTQDYTQRHFEGVALNLFELFRANMLETRQPIIANRTFTDCLIEGPAVLLAVGGVDFDSCNLGVSPDPSSLMLRPVSPNKVVGAIGMKDCSFLRCQFYAVGYTGPESFINAMLNSLNQPRPANS